MILRDTLVLLGYVANVVCFFLTLGIKLFFYFYMQKSRKGMQYKIQTGVNQREKVILVCIFVAHCS